jgi:predicted enzyme related to lactoylglutathione lyase
MSSVTRTYFMLTVTDMARAVNFYRQVLGPVVRTESETWTEIKLGEATVALHLSDLAAPKWTGLGVDVDDLTAAYYAVLDHGGQVIAGPTPETTGRLSYEVADTEGNTFTIAGLAPATPAAPGVATQPASAAPSSSDAGPDPANPAAPH